MAITIRFTGETSKMSWVALPVEPASRAMLLFDLLEKKILTPDGLNLKEVDRRKEYENEFE